MHADTHQILQEVSASNINPSNIVTSDQSPSPSSSNMVSSLDSCEGGLKRPSKRRKNNKNVSNASRPAKLDAPQVPKSDPVQVARANDRRIRGRRGHLKMMTEMPLDTLFEIFDQLEPVDLLHLSWSSKSLNAIVMGKAARFLWENVFTRLYASENPPPPCPADLNLAQYTRFLFAKKCMECEAALGLHDSWVMRLRACRKCLMSQKFVSPSWVCCDFHEGLELSTIMLGNQVLYKKSEHDQLETKMEELQWRTVTRVRDEWNLPFRKRENGQVAYETWKSKKKEERKDELDSARSERRNSILERLKEIGWDEPEIRKINHNRVSTLPGVLKPKLLTDREWKNLQPKLLTHLQQLEAIYISERRSKFMGHLQILKQQIDKLRSSLPVELLPLPEDLAILEPYRSSIFFMASPEPETAPSDEELGQSITEWNEVRRRCLLSLLPRDLADIQGPDPLELASVFFFVEGYPKHILSFLQVCVYRKQGPGTIPDDAPKELSQMGGSFTRPWFWDSKFCFNHRAHEIAKSIITHVGQDPLTATASGMGNTLLFRCLRCPGYRATCRWSDVINHETNFHDDEVDLSPKDRWSPEDKWEIARKIQH